MPLKLMYITNRTDVALVAEKYGVDRIWVDLETLGKELRQKNFDSVKSHHTIADVQKIRKVLTKSLLMVRINPWNENSEAEIEKVIEAGADIIMLPMWQETAEVKNFINAVRGRTKVSLLLETRGAEKCLKDVLKLGGIDEIHIGLNDLHIQYGLKFMFELLANGTVDRICNEIEKSGIPYGFGGVGKIGEGMLPAEYIIAEHYRLGSSAVILSRSFCNTEKVTDIKDIEAVFAENLEALRMQEKMAEAFTVKQFEENRSRVEACVEKIVESVL